MSIRLIVALLFLHLPLLILSELERQQFRLSRGFKACHDVQSSIILSGEMDTECIPELKAVQGVQSVSVDSLKRAL